MDGTPLKTCRSFCRCIIPCQVLADKNSGHRPAIVYKSINDELPFTSFVLHTFSSVLACALYFQCFNCKSSTVGRVSMVNDVLIASTKLASNDAQPTVFNGRTSWQHDMSAVISGNIPNLKTYHIPSLHSHPFAESWFRISLGQHSPIKVVNGIRENYNANTTLP